MVIMEVTLPGNMLQGLHPVHSGILRVHRHNCVREWMCVIIWSFAWRSVNTIVLITLPWNLSLATPEAGEKP